jgi:hypothetical protein
MVKPFASMLWAMYFQVGDNHTGLGNVPQIPGNKEELKSNTNNSVAYNNIASAYTGEQDYRHALFLSQERSFSHFLPRSKRAAVRALDYH